MPPTLGVGHKHSVYVAQPIILLTENLKQQVAFKTPCSSNQLYEEGLTSAHHSQSYPKKWHLLTDHRVCYS